MRVHVGELKSQLILAEIVKECKALEVRREDCFAYQEEQDALKKKWGFAYYGLTPITFPAEE
jgi:hypothetical protein